MQCQVMVLKSGAQSLRSEIEGDISSSAYRFHDVRSELSYSDWCPIMAQRRSR